MAALHGDCVAKPSVTRSPGAMLWQLPDSTVRASVLTAKACGRPGPDPKNPLACSPGGLQTAPNIFEQGVMFANASQRCRALRLTSMTCKAEPVRRGRG